MLHDEKEFDITHPSLFNFRFYFRPSIVTSTGFAFLTIVWQ
jgi:hypothetical protein